MSVERTNSNFTVYVTVSITSANHKCLKCITTDCHFLILGNIQEKHLLCGFQHLSATVSLLVSRLVSLVFTALHGMQTRSSGDNSVRLYVCPSVRPSVKRVNCDKTEEQSVQLFTPYERSFSLVFWEKEWLLRATPSTWNFVSNRPRWSEIADFQSIFARSASTVTPSKKFN